MFSADSFQFVINLLNVSRNYFAIYLSSSFANALSFLLWYKQWRHNSRNKNCFFFAKILSLTLQIHGNTKNKMQNILCSECTMKNKLTFLHIVFIIVVPLLWKCPTYANTYYEITIQISPQFYPRDQICYSIGKKVHNL